MNYNVYHNAVSAYADRKMELRDMLDAMGALAFMFCAMAAAVALL